MGVPSSASPRSVRRRLPILVVAFAVLTISGATLVASAGAGADEHKVTLCHATDSATNPYTTVTVDYHSVVKNGHGGHEGPVFPESIDGKWGDIIPAFDFGPGAQFSGQNLDGNGQAILANGCAVESTTTTAPPQQ